MKISFAETAVPKSGTIVVGVSEDRLLTPAAAALDRDADGALTRAMASSRFEGKKDQLLTVLAPANLAAGRVVLAGLGKVAEINALQLQNLGGNLVAHLGGTGETEIAVLLGEIADLPCRPARRRPRSASARGSGAIVSTSTAPSLRPSRSRA